MKSCQHQNSSLSSFRFLFSVFVFILLFLSLTANHYLLVTSSASAQELGIGVAVRVSLLDKEAPDGSVVSWSSGGYRLATIPYDSGLFGVVVDNPALSLENAGLPQSHPVLSVGEAQVRVSLANGPIKEGDAITSSNKPGVGQKADRSGYILGTALEDFTSPPVGGEEKKIWVTVNISSSTSRSLRENLFDLFRLGWLTSFEAPLNALRYLLASVFMILSFILGFIFFGRVVARGVEAMGRNPLAGSLIAVSVVFNLVLTIVIMLVGLGVAYLILRL